MSKEPILYLVVLQAASDRSDLVRLQNVIELGSFDWLTTLGRFRIIENHHATATLRHQSRQVWQI